MPRHVTPRRAASCRTTPCRATPRRATPRRGTYISLKMSLLTAESARQDVVAEVAQLVDEVSKAKKATADAERGLADAMAQIQQMESKAASAAAEQERLHAGWIKARVELSQRAQQISSLQHHAVENRSIDTPA